jgi:hypothetical protein
LSSLCRLLPVAARTHESQPDHGSGRRPRARENPQGHASAVPPDFARAAETRARPWGIIAGKTWAQCASETRMAMQQHDDVTVTWTGKQGTQAA